MEKVSQSLAENQTYLQDQFKNSMDFMMRELTLSGTAGALFALDGLVSKQTITLSILNPLMGAPVMPGDGPMKMKFIEQNVLGSVEQKRETQMEQILLLLMSGFAVLLLDGCGDALVFGVQGFDSRGPEEPQNEVMQRGAKDGFTESYQSNMAMIRRRMKTTSLKFEKAQVGGKSHTPLAICYLEGVASPQVIEKIKRRLAKCDLQTALGAGYLVSFLERGGIFTGVGMSERPDVVCGKIEEGRVAILVEGTPSVLLVPFLFVENFQTLDDYLTRPFYGTFIRWLKYLAFFLSAFLPGLYVAITTHHPELLPESLLLKIAEAEAQTPFPVMAETLLLYFLYEVLREAGLRAPRSLSAIAGYAVPRLYEPLALLRLAFLLAGNFLGVWGVMLGLVLLLLNLCGSESFGVPLLTPVAPYSGRLVFRDVFTRAGWQRLAQKDAVVQDMPGSRELGQ